ncbi:capsular exopolysaccharide family [Phocaeicola salanitronis DSM 18170]|uniref:non-specific protein-tyrosine kinase n=1 Tax=Phocaeicola salanitronis (strain DSM 18170 / JCM 13657 / CCUG 60908 / BL78) TaxID=667015 RepID=F0R0C9_PHOSB|nr:polysaccharide biosynthesis tyrosine autokinase [Phocaeicola salanitronis]ADY37273.1 capsular exopolysaccharide family [Phocaeicola salanitronis DSM 18170]
MAIPNNPTRPKQGDDFIRIQDLFYLCLAKWRWFVVSLVLTLGIAVYYLLTTPPVYTRAASLLIKEDSKGQSLSGDVGSTFADMGLFQANTNVNNELLSLQSPAVMLDVVKRLHLHTDYLTDGTFYKQVLYGQTLPFSISFFGLQDNETASLTLRQGASGKLELSDFTRNGEKVEGISEGKLNDTIASPVGKLLVEPTPYYNIGFHEPVYVSRSSLHGATGAYSSRLSVVLSDEKSTVINLSFQDVCIQRAEDVLNTVIAVYNENWVKDKNQIAVSTSMFINERLGVIEGELGNVDENISSYKSEHLLPDVQAASNLYMAQSSETNAQILALNTQLSMARYIRNYLTAASSRNQLLPANSGIESANIEQQIGEYNTMQLQRNNLVANSSEQNPLVKDLDQSLASMRRAIITSVDNLMVTLDTRIRSLQRSEQQTTERLAANPSQAKYLLSVERQQKVKEALYLFLLQKREENELSQAFTAYNTRVITPPTGSMLPTAPVRRNILLVAFALGLLIPVVIVFVRENMNTKVRGKKDLECLSMPFAGEIPLAGESRRKHLFASKTYDAPRGIVVKQGKRNIINEAFRVLRTNLEFMTSENEKANVILLTSFNPGSGKTFLSLNIAGSLALKGKKVLIIDGDLRKASVSAFIDSPKTGLSDYLGRKTDAIDTAVVEAPQCPGLYILPVGTLPPNPTELLAEDRFGKLVAGLRDRYDYIFIDCPPIEIVADTQIIEKVADRTLFIVRAGLLERSMLAELETIYQEKRFKNMAVILNGTLDGNNRYGYKYGYKYGYHYGYGSKDYYNNE